MSEIFVDVNFLIFFIDQFCDSGFHLIFIPLACNVMLVKYLKVPIASVSMAVFKLFALQKWFKSVMHQWLTLKNVVNAETIF